MGGGGLLGAGSDVSGSGCVPDWMLGPGIVVVVEPDGSEIVCFGDEQLDRQMEACRARGHRPRLRWRDADGLVRASPDPAGTGSGIPRAHA